MDKTIDKYSDRAEKYEKSRPEYPKEILTHLKNYGYEKDSIMADIGSGTGKLSKIFLENDNKVYCVEPNENMRRIADSLFKNFSNYFSINGTAEKTGLKNNSIGFITVGQAFHWFDKEKALHEFKRILKNSGLLILIWNRIRSKTTFQKEFGSISNFCVKDNLEIVPPNISGEEIVNIYSKYYKKIIIENSVNNNLSDTINGFFSAAYAPKEGTPEYEKILYKIEQIFEKHNNNGLVEFDYDTEIYIGKI
jgi:ubiquinone/menaquinone biosynthesis C-methylase UbiE